MLIMNSLIIHAGNIVNFHKSNISLLPSYEVSDVDPIDQRHNFFNGDVEFQIMNSTHNTQFYSGDVIISYQKSSAVALGLGAEFSYCKLHNDNGWKLSHLRFLPVFFDNKFYFFRNSRLCPFLHLSEGISFNNYTKEETMTNKPPYHVSEEGFYAYTGIGCKIRTGTRYTPTMDLGFQGYRFSGNNLDVNPHGITLRLGVIF